MSVATNFIDVALEQARVAADTGENAVGAALVKDDDLIAVSRHRVGESNDPIAHAAMDCIRRAGRRIDYPDLTLYLTSAPCMMCAGAILQFGIGNVVVGAQPSNNEIIGLLCDKGVNVEMLNHAKCKKLGQEIS